MSLRTRLLEFLQVPAAPSAPAGDDDVRIFRAAPNFLRYKFVLWGIKHLTALIGVVVGLGFLRVMPNPLGSFEIAGFTFQLSTLFGLIETAAVLGFVAESAWSLALLRLDFEQRWYLVSDRSLRIREGLVRMHEKTMTYANIQHVTIEQGPLQRLLGIADLQVRTAGGGGGSSDHESGSKSKPDMHVAYFRGVSDAAAIRETIRERMRRYADAGLGDPDDVREASSSQANEMLPPVPLLTAAQALAYEARALRHAVSAVR